MNLSHKKAMTILIDTAIKATIKAGQAIIEIYTDPTIDFSVERKADNSPLTIADKAANKIIEELLQETGIPILSEEGKHTDYKIRKQWKRFWLVDPLDGTKEFIKKNDEFTVNIALIVDQKPVMGVIYIPVTQMLYIGNITEGAWKFKTDNKNTTFQEITKNGTKIPKDSKNDHYVIVGSRSHMSKETETYINKLAQEHGKIEMISSGSSIKICMVAEGKADEYPRFGPTMEWDTAAGHAIANAAGKTLWLSDFSNELIYNKENLLNPYFIVK